MTSVAILIDGGFLLRRLPTVRRQIDADDPAEAVKAVRQLVGNHLNHLNNTYRYPNPFRLLHRIFYYDATPYDQKAHTPVSHTAIDYAKTATAKFRKEFFDILRGEPNVALRLGHVHKDGDRSWILKAQPQKDLLSGHLSVDELTDDHFVAALRQKGVDMRIGIDIASLTLRRQANVIVLVSGDADFVPAAKLARREGVRVILDPLWHNVSLDLYEHIDGLRSGFPNPTHADPIEDDSS